MCALWRGEGGGGAPMLHPHFGATHLPLLGVATGVRPSPLPFDNAMAEIDEKKLRRAIRAEERHLREKRLKRVETMTTGVPYAGEDGASTSSEIEEELHEHALGSSDSSGSDHGSVYGRRGQVMAGAKLMKDPLLRSGGSKHRGGWSKKVSKSMRRLHRNGSSGRRSKLKRRQRAESDAKAANSANGKVMAHQLLMLEETDNDSDEEEAGGDAFNASMGMGGMSVSRMLKSGVRSTIFEGEQGEETRLRCGCCTVAGSAWRPHSHVRCWCVSCSGNVEDTDGDSDAVTEAQLRRNRRQSVVAQARRRLSMHLTANGLAAQVALASGGLNALHSPGGTSHRSFNSPKNSPSRGLGGNFSFFAGDTGSGSATRRVSVRGSVGGSRRASVRASAQGSPAGTGGAAPRSLRTSRRSSNVFHNATPASGSGGTTSKHTRSIPGSTKHGSGNTSTKSRRKSSRR